MKSIIKKLSIILLLIILMMTTSSSLTISKAIENDTIVTITPTQLKETNLIFAEHSKLLKENELLNSQLNNYIEENSILCKIDSTRQEQLISYRKLNNSLNISLEKSKKKLLYWQVGGITVSLGLLVFLLIK
jgi:broad-specificity NMP kinase